MTNPISLLPTSVPTIERAESLAAGLQAGTAEAAPLAQDFESLFISILLKEMRQTTEGEGLFGGEASDTYGGLFDLYFSQHLAGAGGLGISDLLATYLDTEQTP